MSGITQLDQVTINKIAAGEVIERPSAVVKELVENSIDAGSQAITVEIKNGGISFIRVTDNGTGIPKMDVPIAFLRHATSKIKTVEDLLSISSLGFRGEALSSIAAVSQVELITKTNEELSGLRYVIEGGLERSIEEIGCPSGSTILVRNLFYNTPARRKFLKSSVTEAGYISELMERLAQAHSEISFKFIHNNQIKLHTSGNNNKKDIIYHIYGRELTSNLLAVTGKKENTSLEGFIGKPVISRGNRNYQNYFINGRFIRSSVISKAIEEAYKPYIMSHRYPFTMLHFHIDSEFLDVNVHPTKMEIRFKNSEEVYTLTFRTIRDALAEKELIPEVILNSQKEEKHTYDPVPEPFEQVRREELRNPLAAAELDLKDNAGNHMGSDVKKHGSNIPMTNENKRMDKSTLQERPVDLSVNEKLEQTNIEAAEYKEIMEQTEIGKLNQVIQTGESLKEEAEYGTDGIVKAAQLSLFEEPLLGSEARANHRIIGQLFSTYWILEYNDKMFIIDQHAAHEKVLFEKTMASIQNKEFYSQMLHPPLILTLSMREEETLRIYSEALNTLGFEIEHFGGKEYSVRAVPGDLLGIAQNELLIELIDALGEKEAKESMDLILERAASLSCKAAVKGNSRLSLMEASALIDQLMELENPYHCPHGRPTIIAMSKYEIEKKFKRIL